MARRSSKFGEAEQRELYSGLIKNQAKRINDRYRALEKAGLEDASQSYKTVEHYAVSDPKGKGKMYNMDYATGHVRVSADTRKMTVKEMKEYSETLGQILKHKTSTVSGTKKAMEKAYQTAKEDYNFQGTQEDYTKIWNTYKNNVEPDKRQKLDSEIVMTIMEYSDIYKMGQEDIDAAMQYINRAEDKDEALFHISQIQDAIEIMENNPPEEAAEMIRNAGYQGFAGMFPHIFESIMEYL